MSTESTAAFTVEELILALERSGVSVHAPPLPLGSSSAALVDGARNAIDSGSWSILHSGASDYILAGPASRLTPDAVTQALIELHTENARVSDAPAPKGRLTGGFSCIHCNKFNVLRNGSEVLAADRWFAVTVGKEVGVFQGSHIAGSLVNNVTGGMRVGYNTKQEAEAAFAAALAAGAVKRVVPGTQESVAVE